MVDSRTSLGVDCGARMDPFLHCSVQPSHMTFQPDLHGIAGGARGCEFKDPCLTQAETLALRNPFPIAQCVPTCWSLSDEDGSDRSS